MTVIRILGALAVLLLFLLGCGGDGGTRPVRSSDLFPLAVGNIWNYTGGKSDTITAREFIDENVYYQFNSAFPFDLVRMNELGQLVLIVRCCGETVLFDFQAQVGESWIFDDCTDGPFIEITLLAADDEVSVPAGLFTGCYRFAFIGIHYLLCPGVGLVAAESQVGTNSYQLRSYGLEDPEPVIPSQNLVVNGSFERFCCPSFVGWTVFNPALTSPANDTPADGGCWSLRLTADWAPTTAILRQRIAGVADGDVLRLSAQVRAEDPMGGGSIGLLVGKAPWTKTGKWASTNDTLWTGLSLVDTLSMEPGDSVWVEISSFHTEIVPRVGFFDLVVLERAEQ